MKIYENDEIYVRPLLESDTNKENYLQWFYDQEVCRYNSHGKMSHGRDYSKPGINPNKHIVWAVIKKEYKKIGENIPYTDEELHIGNVNLNIDWINRNAEFTCIFGEKKYWGKGYCTQTMKWLFTHGFNNLNLHKIWLGTAKNNIGMQIAADRLGMKKEGRLKDHVFINGGWLDIIKMFVFQGIIYD